ncbi:MAG: hypothetical protein J4O03_12340, partial [Chloroflexi bacterium]|nr:hypothetical protein [Chloroflexota bacterium]
MRGPKEGFRTELKESCGRLYRRYWLTSAGAGYLRLVRTGDFLGHNPGDAPSGQPCGMAPVAAG